MSFLTAAAAARHLGRGVRRFSSGVTRRTEEFFKGLNHNLDHLPRRLSDPKLAFPAQVHPSEIQFRGTRIPNLLQTEARDSSLQRLTAGSSPKTKQSARLQQTMKDGYNNGNHLEHQVMHANFLDPMVNEYSAFLKRIEDPEQRAFISESLGSEPLRFWGTMHPMLHLVQEQRDFMLEILKLTFIDHKLDQLAKDSPFEELYFLYFHSFPTVEKALMAKSPFKLDLATVKKHVQRQMMKNRSDAARLSTNLEIPRTYEIERKILDTHLWIQNMIAADLSLTFNRDMSSILEARSWKKDGDGKDFKDEHNIECYFSSQMTNCLASLDVIKEIEACIRYLGEDSLINSSAETSSFPGYSSLDFCEEIKATLIDAIGQVNKGSFMSRQTRAGIQSNLSDLLDGLSSKLTGSMKRQVDKLNLVLGATKLQFPGDTYRQEGDRWTELIDSLGLSVTDTVEEASEKIAKLGELPPVVKKETLRALSLQGSDGPQLIISQWENADQVSACVLFQRLVPVLKDNASFQDYWLDLCDRGDFNPDCISKNDLEIPVISVLPETLDSITAAPQNFRKVLENEQNLQYFKETGGPGMTASRSDGSSKLSAAVVSLFDALFPTLDSICKEKGLDGMNERVSMHGLGVPDLERTAPHATPRTQVTAQGEHLMDLVTPDAFTYTKLFGNGLFNSNPLALLSLGQLDSYFNAFTLGVRNHWDTVFEPVTVDGRRFIGSHFTVTQVPQRVIKGSLGFTSARKVVRDSVDQDPLETKLNIRRISDVNDKAIRSESDLLAFPAADYNEDQLAVLSFLFRRDPSTRDMMYNLSSILALHDSYVLAATQLGVHSDIPNFEERERVVALSSDSVRTPGDAALRHYCKIERLPLRAFANLAFIVSGDDHRVGRIVQDYKAEYREGFPDHAFYVSALFKEVSSNSSGEDQIIARGFSDHAADNFLPRIALRRQAVFAALKSEKEFDEGRVSTQKFESTLANLAYAIRTGVHMYKGNMPGLAMFDERFELQFQQSNAHHE